MRFTEDDPASPSRTSREKLDAIHAAAGALELRQKAEVNPGSEYRIGLLDVKGRSGVKLPVTLFGKPGSPNRIILLGPPDRLAAGTLIADGLGLRERRSCVILADVPETPTDIAAFSSVVLDGRPARLIVVDPTDDMGYYGRRIFQDRVQDRNREAAAMATSATAAQPIEPDIIGGAELGRRRSDADMAQAVVAQLARRVPISVPVVKRRARAAPAAGVRGAGLTNQGAAGGPARNAIRGSQSFT